MKTSIDPNVIYKATKTTVKDDTAFRMVQKDFEIVGQAEILKNPRHDEVYQLQVGGPFGLTTSAVLKVTQNGDNFIIETKNSVYTLEKINE